MPPPTARRFHRCVIGPGGGAPVLLHATTASTAYNIGASPRPRPSARRTAAASPSSAGSRTSSTCHSPFGMPWTSCSSRAVMGIFAPAPSARNTGTATTAIQLPPAGSN
ncbi:hypothetical protein PVAP13_1NG377438 [Panicum virgatum]|uniref:Uncharacterized protein n=1 Tax=Panicum virgatum TaxID=38727 RepID=A0A8T0WT68_PANVG|nr:hypothetical protein PVAP13_1NG377438 [Panicum virgatum]